MEQPDRFTAEVVGLKISMAFSLPVELDTPPL